MNKTKMSFGEQHLQIIKLLSLSVGLSLIATVITSLTYAIERPNLSALIRMLTSKIYASHCVINLLSGFLLGGFFVLIFYYGWQAHERLENDQYDQGWIIGIHIALVFAFFLLDMLGIPNLVKNRYLTMRKVWMFFIFYLLAIYTLLRLLHAFINWLAQDNNPKKADSNNAPRITAVLTMLGTILGYLLGK